MLKYGFLLAALLPLLLLGCDKYGKPSPGEKFARTYCSSCHLFPDPSLLDKNTWQEKILPPMGALLGIGYYNGQPFQDVRFTRAGAAPAGNTIVPLDAWLAIVNYYTQKAPETLPGQDRPAVELTTDRFEILHPTPVQPAFASATFVKIDPANHWVYAASATDSTLHIYDKELRRKAMLPVQGSIVDMDFATPLKNAGPRSGVLTYIGIINPNDLKRGAVESFSIDTSGALNRLFPLLDTLPRSAQTLAADFDNDGKEDYLICGFGNTVGALFWMKNLGEGHFEKKIISPLPGALKAYIDDYNGDGLPDISVLMTQAQEGIFLFVNKGNGRFEPEELLRFPPVQGSSYFEWVDFNKDGRQDILYTCGDNADYSSQVLKYYHGVYIYLNEGDWKFRQTYFFPIHGCYKAVARDFDLDGDLDLATISYFPDWKNQPQEGFVYLENKGKFQFAPFTIKEYDAGQWLTLDADDVDGDGDDDIVIGSVSSYMRNPQQPNPKAPEAMSAILLLKNKVHQ